MKKDTTKHLKALTDALSDKLDQVLEDALDRARQEDVDLGELEEVTQTSMQQLGQCFLELLVEAVQSEERAEAVPCRCGGRAEFERYRKGTVVTTVGQIEVRRAYYLCPKCHEGVYPVDERLGFMAGGLSAALQEMVALVGIHVPFETASELVERMLQVSVSDNGVRASTERIGQERGETEQTWVEAAWGETCELPEGPEEPPQRLYGSIDGTSVRTDEGWREPKLGSWYTTDDPPGPEPPEEWEPRAEAISYYGDLEEAKDFGRLVYLTGRQRGAHEAEEIVFVADGAKWIWNVVEEHFPRAVQIVDWYHAAERIWGVAHAVYGEGSEAAQAWATVCLDALWEGHFEDVLQALHEHVDPDQEEDPARQALTYFQNNRHRMRYPEFRAQGYQIGSGTIESGCKRVIGARMKQAGMTWTTDGVRQVLKARAMYFSDEWDDFCRQRDPPRRTYTRCVA